VTGGLDALIRYAITTRTSEIEGGNDSHAMCLYGDALIDVLDLHPRVAVDSDNPDGRAVCGSCIGSDEDLLDYPCPTVQAIARALKLVDPPPAEPTREPRVWQYRIDSDVPQDVQAFIGKKTGTRYEREPDRQFMWRGGNMVNGIGTILVDERELVEVVDAGVGR
jgi:hypothetical protein